MKEDDTDNAYEHGGINERDLSVSLIILRLMIDQLKKKYPT